LKNILHRLSINLILSLLKGYTKELHGQTLNQGYYLLWLAFTPDK